MPRHVIGSIGSCLADTGTREWAPYANPPTKSTKANCAHQGLRCALQAISGHHSMHQPTRLPSGLAAYVVGNPAKHDVPPPGNKSIRFKKNRTDGRSHTSPHASNTSKACYTISMHRHSPRTTRANTLVGQPQSLVARSQSALLTQVAHKLGQPSHRERSCSINQSPVCNAGTANAQHGRQPSSLHRPHSNSVLPHHWP